MPVAKKAVDCTRCSLSSSGFILSLLLQVIVLSLTSCYSLSYTLLLSFLQPIVVFRGDNTSQTVLYLLCTYPRHQTQGLVVYKVLRSSEIRDLEKN